MNCVMHLFRSLALLATVFLFTACRDVFVQNYTAHYTWDFYKLRPDATPKEKAFKECEAASRRRNRFIGDETIRGYSHAGDVLACMKWEGWGQSTNPVTFKPIQRVE